MSKFRYIMSGMFYPTNGHTYEIDIPSPYLRDSKEDAEKDSIYGYRFIKNVDGNPVVAVFEGEDFDVVKENEKKQVYARVTGNIIKTYNFDTFIKEGGVIRMLKPEVEGSGFINGETDFLDTNETFKDVFPNMEWYKTYYIDNEAYYIKEES